MEPRRPEPAHIHNGGYEQDGGEASLHPADEREREATELGRYPLRPSTDTDPNFAPDSPAAKMFRRVTTTSYEYGGSAIRRFWRRQIHLSVPHKDCRDHLALERTYLGYLRTSLALTNSAITIAQLFRLQDVSSPLKHGFYNLGQPVALILISAGIITCLCGGWRFWRQQNALARGKIHASGWDFILVGGIVITMLAMLLGIVLGVNGEGAKHDPSNPMRTKLRGT